MEDGMRASDVMVRAVVTASPDTTVEALARLMVNLRIGGVPVLDTDGVPVGMVTEGDLLRRVEIGTERHGPRWSEPFSSNSQRAADYIKSHAKWVRDIMTGEVFTVDEAATLGEIADLLEARKIKRVPVVHDGKIVGIVSRADLLKVLASGGIGTPDEEADRTIRLQLLAELRDQNWTDTTEDRVVVANGIVHLWGLVRSEEERRALRIAAENTPGVRGIEDHTQLAPAQPAV
jgi:CBS domain-containing protein